jgi:hypothetical protein
MDDDTGGLIVNTDKKESVIKSICERIEFLAKHRGYESAHDTILWLLEEIARETPYHHDVQQALQAYFESKNGVVRRSEEIEIESRTKQNQEKKEKENYGSPFMDFFE